MDVFHFVPDGRDAEDAAADLLNSNRFKPSYLNVTDVRRDERGRAVYHSEDCTVNAYAMKILASDRLSDGWSFLITNDLSMNSDLYLPSTEETGTFYLRFRYSKASDKCDEPAGLIVNMFAPSTTFQALVFDPITSDDYRSGTARSLVAGDNYLKHPIHFRIGPYSFRIAYSSAIHPMVRQHFAMTVASMTNVAVLEETWDPWNRLLGSGSQAVVSLASGSKSGALRAVKSFRDTVDQNKISHEIELLLQIDTKRCKQIITFFGATSGPSQDESAPLNRLFLEACHGSVAALMKDSLAVIYLPTIAQDVASGLKYLHDNNVVHRNINLSNILFKVRSVGHEGYNEDFLVDHLGKSACEVRFIIAGFGNAVLWDMKCTQYCGTKAYMAPEIRSNGKKVYDHCVDIWSFGATLFHIWDPVTMDTSIARLDKHPRGHDIDQDRAARRRHAESMWNAPDPAWINPGLWTIIKSMLASFPGDRPAADKLVEVFEEIVISSLDWNAREPLLERGWNGKFVPGPLLRLALIHPSKATSLIAFRDFWSAIIVHPNAKGKLGMADG